MTFDYRKSALELIAAADAGCLNYSENSRGRMIAEFRARAAEFLAEADRIEDAKKERSLLMSLGGIARRSGWVVKSSRFDGKISSFYASKDGRKVRISDHDLPDTTRRNVMGLLPQFVIDEETTLETFKAWLDKQ